MTQKNRSRIKTPEQIWKNFQDVLTRSTEYTNLGELSNAIFALNEDPLERFHILTELAHGTKSAVNLDGTLSGVAQEAATLLGWPLEELFLCEYPLEELFLCDPSLKLKETVALPPQKQKPDLTYKIRCDLFQKNNQLTLKATRTGLFKVDMVDETKVLRPLGSPTRRYTVPVVSITHKF